MFSATRVRPTSRRKPGEIHWASLAPEPGRQRISRYYLSNARGHSSGDFLAYLGGSWWRTDTEFETEKSNVGLDEYETRTWAGWHHPTIAVCLLAGAFLVEPATDSWGEKDAPGTSRPQVYRCGARDAAPGAVRC